MNSVLSKAVNTGTLTNVKVSDLRGLISELHDVFSDRKGRTELARHEVHLTSETPVRSKT